MVLFEFINANPIVIKNRPEIILRKSKTTQSFAITMSILDGKKIAVSR